VTQPYLCHGIPLITKLMVSFIVTAAVVLSIKNETAMVVFAESL